MTLTLEQDTFHAEWTAWREERERTRRDPHGFLAYRAVHVLDGEPRTFPGVPGRWSTGVDGPVVELGTESLTVDGAVVTGRHRFGPVAEREFRRAAAVGDVILELSRRGGHDLLRPLDPAHGLRADYLETPAFAPDPAWALAARFDRYPARRARQIQAAVEGIVHTHEAVGEVAFTLDGAEHRLVVLGFDRAGNTGFVLFRDATSGITTYAASRTLLLPLPEPGDTAVVLDFNRAANLQCAYTDHAPCPLAPPENRLPFAVEAGEQTPTFRSSTLAYWREPEGVTPRGTLVVVPGRGEHAALYARFGRRLAADGYRVVAVPDPTADPRPLALVGSDTGALFAAGLAARGLVDVDALVLAGLPVGSQGGWSDELDARTTCPVHRARLAEDPVVRHGALAEPVPQAWLQAAVPDRITVPVLGLHGAADPVAPLDGVRDWYDGLASTELIGIVGGRHDALNDQTHRTAAAAVVQFLVKLRAGVPEIARVELARASGGTR